MSDQLQLFSKPIPTTKVGITEHLQEFKEALENGLLDPIEWAVNAKLLTELAEQVKDIVKPYIKETSSFRSIQVEPASKDTKDYKHDPNWQFLNNQLKDWEKRMDAVKSPLHPQYNGPEMVPDFETGEEYQLTRPKVSTSYFYKATIPKNEPK